MKTMAILLQIKMEWLKRSTMRGIKKIKWRKLMHGRHTGGEKI